ncbi:MAG TPA: copper resistance protein CopC, partial [Acidimicrobiales bacterium]|nr:copper resistance protein CopC [Acidimicrobiales bacterium]
MRRVVLRSLAVAAVAVGTLVLAAAPAGAHALPQSSDPAAGATLKQAPTTVRVTFGETPDPRLSRLQVLDSSSQDHTRGKTEAVASDPKTLQVALGTIADGVYTVSWRTVSEVDDHLAAGTFAFGVGVAPTGAAATGGFSTKSPSPSTTGVVARWLLYAGLMGLVGGAFVAVICYPSLPRRTGGALAAGCALAAIGAAGITVDARRAAHLRWSKLWGSSLGHAFAWRIIPLLAAVVLVGAGLRLSRPRRRRVVVGLAGVAGLAAMWGDVESSHASAAHSLRLLRMTDQWVHFAAAGVWVGGLAALLATIGAAGRYERVRAATRYSLAALCSIVVVAGTGFQRGYDEIGSLHRLFHTGFGQYVLVKIALLGVLLGLGAINRYRSVPAVDRSPRLLHLVGRTELVLLTAVLTATGIIQSLAPPTSAAAAPAVHPLVLSAHDFATTVRVKLTISPDTAGFNQFTLTVADYDTGAPMQAAASLTFNLPSRPDLGSSTLALETTRAGVFSANGANLSINGTWRVVVNIQRPTGGVQIPF